MSYMCCSCKHKNSVVCVRCKYCERYEREKMTNRKELAKLFPPMKRKPKTNYDRLVSKTPEEMVEWIESIEPAACPWRDDYGDDCPYTDCHNCWLGWLRSPVEGSE